jgi:hypothetical protein
MNEIPKGAASPLGELDGGLSSAPKGACRPVPVVRERRLSGSTMPPGRQSFPSQEAALAQLDTSVEAIRRVLAAKGEVI